MNIGDKLKQWRSKIGLGQKEAASFLGVKLSSYQKYEMDISGPGSDAIAAFVRAGINANWLLTGEGPMLRKESPGADELATADHEESAEAQTAPPGSGEALEEPGAAETGGDRQRQELGEIDEDLLFDIVTALEAAFLAPHSFGRAFGRVLEENLEILQNIGKDLDSAKGLGDVDLSGLIKSVIDKWMVYAGMEAGAAARIYNRVRLIKSPERRRKRIEREAVFFTEVKTWAAKAKTSSGVTNT